MERNLMVIVYGADHTYTEMVTTYGADQLHRHYIDHLCTGMARNSFTQLCADRSFTLAVRSFITQRGVEHPCTGFLQEGLGTSTGLMCRKATNYINQL